MGAGALNFRIKQNSRKGESIMNANAFREEELVTRKMKVNGEWESRTFPVVGGRLRILHENNDHLGIQTEIIRLEADFVVVKAAVESQRGKFNGTGTASGQEMQNWQIRWLNW